MATLTNILTNIVVPLGVGATILLGRKWIDNYFSKKLEKYKNQESHELQKHLEAFKHQQTLELQRFKVEVDSILSHKLKLQELEFEFLPVALN